MTEQKKKTLRKVWIKLKRSVWFQLMLNIIGGLIGTLLFQLFTK